MLVLRSTVFPGVTALVEKMLAKLGRQIEGTVRAYNDTVGSLERRVLPAARRFEQLHASHADLEIEPVDSVENVPRGLVAPELAGKEVPEDAN